MTRIDLKTDKNFAILAFDFGTTAVKAVLLTCGCEVIGTSTCGYDLLTTTINFAEQNPHDYWLAAISAVKKVLATTSINPDSIVAISMCTQGMGLIPLDRKGNVLHNNITWLDNRAGKQADEINKKIGENYATATSVVAKIKWLKENEEQIFHRTAFFADCTGFLTYKLTGQLHMELTNSSPYSLDPQQLYFKHKLYEAAGIPLSKMPSLKICTSFVGYVTAEAALSLGVSTDVKVFMGSGDVPTSAAGAGCFVPGDSHICLASSGWFSVLTEDTRLAKTSPGIYQIYGIDKNTLIYGGGVQSVGMLLDWCINQFYRSEQEMLGDDIYNMITRELDDLPPGSDGLVATPWLWGESCPISDEEVKAVFLNISNKHDRRHFVKAAMESVFYSLKWQIEYYRTDTGKEISELGAIGGLCRSDYWLQMAADILQYPIYVPSNVEHAGAVGAGIIANVGLGVTTFSDAKNLLRKEKTFVPNSNSKEVYDRNFEGFKLIYNHVKPLYTILKEKKDL